MLKIYYRFVAISTNRFVRSAIVEWFHVRIGPNQRVWATTSWTSIKPFNNCQIERTYYVSLANFIKMKKLVKENFDNNNKNYNLRLKFINYIIFRITMAKISDRKK